jgi:hypothetical protein
VCSRRARKSGAAGRVLASPFQYYVDGGDNLRIEVVNANVGTVVSVLVRWWTEDGEIKPQRFDVTPFSDRTITRSDFSLGRGAIMNVTAFASGGFPHVGNTFVRVQLIRGLGGATLPIATLIQGYVTRTQDQSYPGSTLNLSTDTNVAPRAIVGTAPAAGAECLETVPTNAIWECCRSRRSCKQTRRSRRVIRRS